MDKQMEIVISKIEEKDTDFAIIRSFVENEEVRKLFFDKIGKHGSLVKVFHSLMDSESDGHMGESDIIFICENKKEKAHICRVQKYKEIWTYASNFPDKITVE